MKQNKDNENGEERKTRENDQQEESSKPIESQSPPLSPAKSSRPKRNIRKSVLYHSGDYEVNYPGVTLEEEKKVTLDPIDLAGRITTKRARSETSESGKGIKKKKEGSSDKEGNVEEFDKLSRQTIEVDQAEEFSINDHVEVSGDPNTQPEVGANEEYEMIDDSAYLQLGAETEIVDTNYTRDGPPQLNISRESYDDEYDEDEVILGRPPHLEVNMPTIKKRGRPKKTFSEENSQRRERVEKGERSRERKAFRVAGDRVISKSLAERVNQFHVKLFEDDIEITELGDCYATVISGCLSYLLRKERIIDLLTSTDEINLIREGGWMLEKPPRLPPLVTHKACFAFYVDGSKINSAKDISTDDLKPWTTSAEANNSGEAIIKPNVRRHPVARINNRLVPIKGDPRLAELHLTEYSAWLPRLLRLRKKIFYLSRDGQIYGNILILYDYTCAGDAPSVINLPHGNDFLRTMVPSVAEEHSNHVSVGDADNPFADEIVQGARGGNFLKVRPTKLGWVHNRKLLLKYLINEPSLLDESSAINRRIPFLPPMTESTGVFVYFVPASFVANQIHHTGDGLSPWTVNHNGESSSPRVRSVRRALIQDEDGTFLLTKQQWQTTGVCLVETMTVLARCPRLRKRVFYIQRNNTIVLGNVCYSYEYVREGPLPTTVKGGSKIHPPSAIADSHLNWVSIRKPKVETGGVGGEEETFIDVEDLEVVEEEVISETIHEMQEQTLDVALQDPEVLDEPTEDVLNDGYDCEFIEDPLLQQDNPDPYFSTPRVLETGHVYLTVRHKRLAGTFECVLEHIANTNIVEDGGLLNYSKPVHPPIVRNARAYAFFVAGTAIFPHDINRDDFSPWSHNGSPENPTCYRTKVRKIGVVCNDSASQFHIKDVDYKSCPFHLVYLYSINPRDPRLRKKIFYMMETESRLVVSHALIIYDYNVEGPLPRLQGGFMKRFSRKSLKRSQNLQMHDVENDVSDMSETEKECPFILPAQVADDGTMYLQIHDMEFWNDRNRQLHFMVNKPSLVDSLGCLNRRVPVLPPASSGKGGFVFFIDGFEVDSRNLTCDGLVPWSENSSTGASGPSKRPKSSKTPLALNREGHLRVWKTPASSHLSHIEYQLHIYSATLPRCPRLKKKVMYVLKNGQQIGNSMIIYLFTESGEMPVPINLNNLTPEVSMARMPSHIRDECARLLLTLSPQEVAKIILETHGMAISIKNLYYLRRRELLAISAVSGAPPYEIKDEILENQFFNHHWGTGLNQDSLEPRDSVERKSELLHVDDESIQVGHTEEIQGDQSDDARFNRASRSEQMNISEQLGLITGESSSERQPNPFLVKSASSAGMIRGSNRAEAIWRIAKSSFGTTTETETFDMLWKLMLDKNEHRLLHNVHQTFGVEIIAGGMDGEAIETGDEQIMHMEEGMGDSLVHDMNEAREGTSQDDVAKNRVGEEEQNDKVYIHQEKDHEGELEQVIVEGVHDSLLEHELVEEVINEQGEQVVQTSTGELMMVPTTEEHH